MPKSPVIAKYKKVATVLIAGAVIFFVSTFFAMVVATWIPSRIHWEVLRIFAGIGVGCLGLMVFGEKLVMRIWRLRVRRVMKLNKRIEEAQQGLGPLARALTAIGRERLIFIHEGDLVQFRPGQLTLRVLALEVGRIGGEFLIRLAPNLPNAAPGFVDPGPVFDGRGRLRHPNQRLDNPTPDQLADLQEEAELTQQVLNTNVQVGTMVQVDDQQYRITGIGDDGVTATLEPVDEPPDRIIQRTLKLQGEFKIVGVEDGRLVRRPAGAHQVLTKDEPIINQGGNHGEVQEGTQAVHGTIQGNAETRITGPGFQGDGGDAAPRGGYREYF